MIGAMVIIMGFCIAFLGMLLSFVDSERDDLLIVGACLGGAAIYGGGWLASHGV
jgi:uncharacterized membrane protein